MGLNTLLIATRKVLSKQEQNLFSSQAKWFKFMFSSNLVIQVRQAWFTFILPEVYNAARIHIDQNMGEEGRRAGKRSFQLDGTPKTSKLVRFVVENME